MIDIKVKKELIKNFKIIKDGTAVVNEDGYKYTDGIIDCGTTIDLELFLEWQRLNYDDKNWSLNNIEVDLENFYEWNFWNEYFKKELVEYSYLDEEPYIKLIKYKISSGKIYFLFKASFDKDNNIQKINVKGFL
jgi:hypothetical protein